MLKPATGYVLVKEVEVDSGVVSTSDISDTQQKFKVLAVGKQEKKQTREILPGDIIYTLKHADADSVPELEDQGLYLIKEDRIMGYER